MYAVIGRRHGKILSADLMEGSGTFMVRAVLPVIESYNFAQEIRKQTSGLAYPQLMFSHWEVSIRAYNQNNIHNIAMYDEQCTLYRTIYIEHFNIIIVIGSCSKQ